MTRAEALKAAAPYLRDFREALDLGRLVICAQCVSFDFAADPSTIGRCRHFSVEAHPFVPFACDRFGRRQRKAR